MIAYKIITKEFIVLIFFIFSQTNNTSASIISSTFFTPNLICKRNINT